MANCRDKILAAIKEGKLPEFSESKVKQLADELEEIKKFSPNDFEAKASQFIKEEQLKATQSRIDTLDKAQYAEKLKNRAMADNFKDPAEGLLAFISRVSSPREKGGAGMEAQIHATVGMVQGEVSLRLTKENLWGALKNKHNQDAILEELVDGVRLGRSVTGNREAFRVAQIIKAGEQMLFEMKRKAGVALKERQDRGLAVFWDSRRIWDGRPETKQASLETFIKKIDPHLNKEFTFESRSSDLDYQKKYYDKLFHQLYRNEFKWSHYDGSKDLDKLMSAERQLVWKDGKSFAAIFREFTGEDLMTVVFNSYEKEARNIVFRRELGIDPEGAIDGAIELIKQQLEKNNDDEGLRKLSSKSKAIKNTFNTLSGGLSRAPVDVASRLVSIARSMQVATKLAGASISSITDVIVMAAKTSTVDGRSLFTNALEGYATVIKSIKNPTEKAEVANMLSLALEIETGANTSRMIAFDNDGRGRAGQYSAAVLKWTGLTGLTNAQYVSAPFMLSRRFAQKADTAWKDLPTRFRGELKKAGFIEAEWDVYRLAKQKAPKAYQSVELVTPQAVRDIVTDDQIKAVMAKHGIEGKSVDDFRWEVFDRSSAMMNNITREAVPTPTARTQAILNQGTSAENIVGQGMRSLTQFKGYPTQMIFTMHSLLRSNPETQAGTLRELGVREYFRTSNMKLLSEFILGTWVMGYVVGALKDIGRNETPKFNEDALIRAFTQGGAGTIYMDILMAGNYQFGGGPQAVLAGPTAGFFADMLTLTTEAAKARSEEDVRKLGKELVKFTTSNTIPNVPVFKEALNYMVLYHLYEAMDPGYLQRLERYRKKEGRVFGAKPHLISSPQNANREVKRRFRELFN